MKNSHYEIDCADNGKTALALILCTEDDLVILDIIMPGLNGISAVEHARKCCVKVPFVIFVTGFSEYAVRAYEISAIDYLVKPVTLDRFFSALDRFERLYKIHNLIGLHSRNSSVNLKTRKTAFHIKHDELVYISSNGKKCVLHCVDSDIEIPKLLGELEKELPRSSFIRNHHRYIVNRKYIRQITTSNRCCYVRLSDSDDTTLPVGRKFLRSVKSIFTSRISNTIPVLSSAIHQEVSIMPQKNITVLIVEDDAISSVITETILKNAGYLVETAAQGEDALAKLNEHHESIDIVLMDIDLGPGMSGIDTTRVINNYYDIPVLFLSSHTGNDIIERTEEVTRFGYLSKNSGDIALLNSIKMALKLHDAEKRLSKRSLILKSLFDSSPNGAGFLVNRIFLIVNDVLCEMTGYPRESLIGHCSRMLYYDLDEFEHVGCELYERDDNSPTVVINTKLRHQNSTELMVTLHSTFIEKGNASKGVTVMAVISH